MCYGVNLSKGMIFLGRKALNGCNGLFHIVLNYLVKAEQSW